MGDNKIEPALTAEEWADVQKYGADIPRVEVGPHSFWTWHHAIAISNASLPDSDPRKITREWVIALRELANAAEGRHDESRELGDYENYLLLTKMADALESYLPPVPR